MRCPYCGQNDDKVVDSRGADGGAVIRRRRECVACGKRFTTYEHVESKVRILVVKKDGSRVPYDRQKVVLGLEKACYKRPIRAEDLLKMVERVEEDLFRRFDREVEAVEIGRSLADELKGMDQIAYVRFASVYKQFRDLDDFLDEVREVLDSAPNDVPNQGRLF